MLLHLLSSNSRSRRTSLPLNHHIIKITKGKRRACTLYWSEPRALPRLLADTTVQIRSSSPVTTSLFSFWGCSSAAK